MNANRRVLVVDDDAVIRRLIRVNLELEGFDVTEAVDGQACLDVVHEVDPDVVVLDVAMPRLDGLATTSQLRAAPPTSGIKIVIVSARAQQADIRRGLDAGADVYLTKPFDPDILIKTVRGLVEDGPDDDERRAP
ncbi:MAG: response regulator transcription factor [Acidothermaceae bacterium]